MKVLHVLDHSLPLHSGYVFRTQGILTEQRALGIETVQVTSAKHQASVDKETVDGFDFYRTHLDDSAFDRIPGGDQLRVVWSLRRRLSEVVAKERPDLLHVHSPCLNGLAAIPVARKAGIPVVYEMRASWEDAAVSHGTAVEGDMRYRLSRFLESYVLRNADAVIAICEGLRTEILSRGVGAEKITVVPNAIDADLMEALDRTPACRAGSAQGAGVPVLGFFGSFYAYEGLLDLVEALPAILPRTGPLKLLLLGAGEQDQAIREAVRRLGLSATVEHLGRVPHDEMASYYKRVDAFVFPRRRMRLVEMVTPLKPLEAMYAGALVLASDVGGHRELIEDGVTGILFQADDRKAMCDAVVDAVANLEAYTSVVTNGRQFVARERTWPKVVSRGVAVYESLLRH